MDTKTNDALLDVQTSRAILSEVAAGGWLVDELPEGEQDLIDLAYDYLYWANKWVLDGNPNDDNINAIINLAKASPPVLSESAVHNHDGDPPGEITYESDKHGGLAPAYTEEDLKIRKTYPRRSSGGFSESDLRDNLVVDRDGGKTILEIQNTNDKPALAEGLPLPKPISEDSLDMPTDLTEVGDKSLRRLYSAFNAYSGRARWRLAIAQSHLANATHLRDAEYRRAYKKYSTELVKSGERATKDLVESFAYSDEDYKEWDEKVNKHEEEVTRWRALSDIYGKNVEILSREWTMRTEQYERER